MQKLLVRNQTWHRKKILLVMFPQRKRKKKNVKASVLLACLNVCA